MKALSAVIVCCLAFSLFGCGIEIKSITDFSE